MAYALAFSPCIGCGRTFGYNPMRVPSVREPLCQVCVNRANMVRRSQGLEPIEPHKDAYEPCPEDELSWEGTR
jgi:hypothetical protein